MTNCSLHGIPLELGTKKILYGLFGLDGSYIANEKIQFPFSRSWEPGGCETWAGQPQETPPGSVDFCPICRRAEMAWCKEFYMDMAMFLDPSLRDELEANCPHEKFHFSNGGYHLVCLRCHATWVKTKAGNDEPDQKAMDWGISFDELRVKAKQSA